MSSAAPGSQNAPKQRDYFSVPARKYSRMSPVATPYVARHLEATLGALKLAPGARLLELGAGMGRFSLPLAERGFEVVATDLSPDLLAELRRFDPEGKVQALEADALLIDQAGLGTFDAVLGFFFLHHLADLHGVFAAAAKVLRPGGVVAFCEPSGLFAPFYLQILLTPGMSLEGEKGMTSMRPGPLEAAARAAGLEILPTKRYGLFPPAIANRAAGRGFEALCEKLSPAWAPLRAFQIFAARRA
jgi:SAM-dependent methyltransferase